MFAQKKTKKQKTFIVYCLANESSETCTNRKLEGQDRQTALKVLLFYKLLGSPRWSIKDCLVEFVFKGCTQVLYPVSMIPGIGFLFLIIIILEPQISIITSVIMIAFSLIISVTLHTSLWKLAPYFKREKGKKKKRERESLLLDCMLKKKKNYRLWNAV